MELSGSIVLPDRIALVANSNITRGTVIKTEMPYLDVKLDIPFQQRNPQTEEEFYQSELNGHTKHIKKAIAKISRVAREVFRQFPLEQDLNMSLTFWARDVVRFKRNAWCLKEVAAHGQHNATTHLALFYNLGKVIHSCRPNCVFEYVDGCGELRAIKDIQPGEELFTDWLPRTLWLENSSTRQEYLSVQHGFHCNCQDCCPASEEHMHGDPLRARLKTLYHKVSPYMDQVPLPRPEPWSLNVLTQLSTIFGEVHEYVTLLTLAELRDKRLHYAHVAMANIADLLSYRSVAFEHAHSALHILATPFGTSPGRPGRHNHNQAMGLLIRNSPRG
jgi:hypothetical protein